jgi:signal transduction histidine kinase
LLRLYPILNLLLCLLPLRIFARQQSYVFQHITSKDGLAIGKASCIFQDSKGYYWVGTDIRLQGVDKHWIAAGTQYFARCTNLSPVHYTFKVQCENRDGIHSKDITVLNIYIHYPWWFAWWAYCLYAVLIGGIAFSLYRNHINQLENKQAAQIKAMVATQEEERKRISRDIHDGIGTKLSALTLFLSSLHEKAFKTKNEEIKSLAKSAAQLIKETMQDVRQLLLNLSPTVLEEFGYTTAVEGLVNKINETKQIHFNLVVFGMNHRLKKDYELALYRITQELINNVLKHAEAKHVSLQIGVRDEKLILLMEDDGKGFDVNVHKEGYGLYNLDARTKLMQGTITIDSQTGRGTSVLIEIPYNFNGQ